MNIFSSITYASCPQLDENHLIFGRLIDGMDTLANMEKIEVDENGQPIEAIRIEDMHILSDGSPEEERIDELDTQQMNVIHKEKRKQCTHLLLVSIS